MGNKPNRVTIPRATCDALLREFHHRCAICGGDRPHIHHIDEDPSHNDLSNLLPLCPNCHLQDQHDPTAPMNRDKLQLFRAHRDPMILHERFIPSGRGAGSSWRLTTGR
jgi:5-methylcytosine-specific restriction endonuclease McrA